jgi:TolB protein
VRLAALLGVVAAAFFVHGADARPHGCNANLTWQDRFPSWSPNGRTIAFLRQQVGCEPPPESIGFVTPGLPAVTFGDDAQRRSWAPPSWAPTGLAVAYGRERGTVRVTAPDGPVGDDGPGAYPSWAGDRIAVTVFTQLQLVQLGDAGGARRALVPSYVKPTQSNGLAVWSPDLTRLAFGVQAGFTEGGIAVVDADGSNFHIVARGPNQSVNPTWSPDGETIAFETNRDGDFEIYSVAVDGARLRNLTNMPQAEDRMPAWHGSTIAFISNRDRSPRAVYGYSLYTMSDDGRVQTWRAADLHPYSAPAWSPDGSKLAYASGRECLRWGIYTLDLATNHSERLTNQCQFLGSPGDDVLRGTPFWDYLGGGAGADVIAGRGGPDRISGGPGNDRLYGGPGDDQLEGDRGTDTIRCGPGRDSVIAERKDRVARDCERVQRY